MTASYSSASPTPPVLKWLLNERAMLCGEVQQTEEEILRLQERLVGLRGKVAALDSTLSLLDSRVRPEAGGAVRATAGRYGPRGGLKAFVVSKLQEAGETGIETVTLSYLAAHHFGMNFSRKSEFSRFRENNVTLALRDLRKEGRAERISKSMLGPYPALWRLKSQPSTLSELVALAKVVATSS